MAACAVVIIVIVIILLKKRKSGDAAEAEVEELPTEPADEAKDEGFQIDQSVFDQKDDENK